MYSFFFNFNLFHKVKLLVTILSLHYKQWTKGSTFPCLDRIMFFFLQNIKLLVFNSDGWPNISKFNFSWRVPLRFFPCGPPSSQIINGCPKTPKKRGSILSLVYKERQPLREWSLLTAGGSGIPKIAHTQNMPPCNNCKLCFCPEVPTV